LLLFISKKDKFLKMRLLIISYEEHSLYVGLNSRINGIVNALLKKGIRVEVAAPTYSKSEKVKRACNDRCELHQIIMPNFFGRFKLPILSRVLFAVFFTYRVIRYFKTCKREYSLIQAEQIYSFWAAFLLARVCNTKVILDDPTMLQYLVDEKLKRFKLINFISQKLVTGYEFYVYNLADYIICSSQKTLTYIDDKIKRVDGKLQYLPNGVDLDVYSVGRREEIGSNLFFNCSLPFYQNTAAIINIAKMLDCFTTKQYDYYFIKIIVNDPSFIPKALRDKFSYNCNVSLLSKVDSLVKYIQDADIVVLPYEQGHFLTAGPRLKVLEAMACGKIVLSTAEGVDGVLGCIDKRHFILCADYVDIANKIIDISENREEFASMLNNIGKNARQLVEKRYSWDKLVETYNILLNSKYKK